MNVNALKRPNAQLFLAALVVLADGGSETQKTTD